MLELSKAVNIPLKSLQEWVNKDRFPRDPEQIKRLADYFGCSFHMMVFGFEDIRIESPMPLIDKITLHSGLYEITIRQLREHKSSEE